MAIPLGEKLGYGPVPSLVACGAGGAFIGYVVSIFLDIFLTNGHSTGFEN